MTLGQTVWPSFALTFLGFLFVATSCGGGDPEATATPPPTVTELPPNTIIIRDTTFVPDELTIKLGKTVTWINTDDVVYVLRDGRYGADFYKGSFQPGEEWGFTFEKTGDFEIGDFRHPGLRGKVIVEE